MTSDAVRTAVTAVLADLGAPADLWIDLGVDDVGLTRFELPDGGTHSVRLEPGSQADLLVAVAHHLQNDVNFWLPGAWGEPLPPCPGHPHPMDPRSVDDKAWWVCPATGDQVSPIGTLGRLV